MIALLAALVMLQTRPAPQTPPPRQAPRQALADMDSADVESHVRTEETYFLMEWRKVWLANYSAGHYARLRLEAVHCHADLSYEHIAPHIIETPFSKRSMCPIWYTDGKIDVDERNGIDLILPPDAQTRVRALRRDLLLLLDSAAKQLPGDEFIAGQRVRLAIDQGELQRAEDAARACRAPGSWCGMLRGFVFYKRGAIASADSTFQHVVAAMPLDERCGWNDLTPVLPLGDRGLFASVKCAARDPLVDRFWWLADPLFVESGNARRAEHYARLVTVELHRDLTVDERWDWLDEHGGGAIAEMLIRYGWPSVVGWGGLAEDQNHFEWLRFTDSSVNVSAEYMAPRIHTTPDYRLLTSEPLSSFTDRDRAAPTTSRSPFFDTGWWPVEHFAPIGGTIMLLDHQSAAFRRERDAWLYVATRLPPPASTGAAAPPYSAALVFARGPGDSTRVVSREQPGARVQQLVMNARGDAGPLVVSAEVMLANDAPGTRGRARFGERLPAGLAGLSGDSVALSDILLFTPPPSGGQLPDNLERAGAAMLASTSVRGDGKLGVFWEMYGVAANDSVDVSLQLSETDQPGLLARLRAQIGLGSVGHGVVAVRWREPQPGHTGSSSMAGSVPIQARSVVLDVSRLNPGGYVLELSVARPGKPPITVTRTLTIEPRSGG